MYVARKLRTNWVVVWQGPARGAALKDGERVSKPLPRNRAESLARELNCGAGIKPNAWPDAPFAATVTDLPFERGGAVTPYSERGAALAARVRYGTVYERRSADAPLSPGERYVANPPYRWVEIRNE